MTTGITEKESELISRSLDEDLSEFELKQLSKNILSKDGGQRTWLRYHAASAVMSKQFPVQIDKDFSAKVMQAIANEEQHTAQTETKQSSVSAIRSYAKQFAGLAVAASVAAVSVVVYQQQSQPGLDGVPAIITSDKRVIEDFQPNVETPTTNSLPVEYSPVQPNNNVREELLTLDRDDLYPSSKAEIDQESLSLPLPQSDVDIIELEDIQ